MNHLRTLSVAVLALATCANAASNDIGTEVHIVFEVCRPRHSIAEGVTLGYQSVSDNGYGGLWIEAGKFFASNEPIYSDSSDKPAHLRAIVARFSDAKQVRFVYLAPEKGSLKFDTWTAWIKPSAITSDGQVEGKILRGIEYPHLVSDGSSPKIRYKLMRFTDFLGTVTHRSSPPTLVEGGPCLSET